MRPPAYRDPARLALGLGFAVAAVAGTMWLILAVPLYIPTCPCPAFLYSNIPGVPVLTLAAGVAAAVAWPGRRVAVATRIQRGLVLGLAGALEAGLAAAVVIPFHDEYFATVYRLYALGFLVAVTGAVTYAAWRQLRGAGGTDGADLLGLPLVFVPIVSAGWLVRGDRVIAAAALAGLLLGIAVAELVARERLRLPRPRAGLVLPALLLAAFLIRLVFGLQVLARNGAGMAFAVASDDGDAYYRFGTALAADLGNLPEVLRGAAFPPLYSAFVGAVFALTRESIAILIALQAAIATWATYLVYRLAVPIAGVTAALIAGLLFATGVDLIHSQTTLTAEALLIPLLLTALWGFTRYRSSTKLFDLVVASLSLAAAFATRNLAILLVIAAIGWLFANERRAPRRFVRDAAIVVGCVVLFVVPTALATAASAEGMRVTSQLAGTAFDTEVDGVAIDNRFLVARGIRPTTDPLGTLSRFASDPLPVIGFYATATVNRLGTLLFFASPGSFDPLFVVNPVLYPNRFGHIAELLLLAALVIACVALIVRRPHARRPEIGLLAAFAILYVATFTLLFVPSHPYRYRLPATPILQIAEAAALVAMARYAVGLWRPRHETPS